jgi:hypothetical protein
VLQGEPPVAVTLPPAPRVFGSREICLQGNNEWGAAAADWLQHRHAAKVHGQASANLKSMLVNDVARAFGNGVEAKRSRSGAITIRELAQRTDVRCTARSRRAHRRCGTAPEDYTDAIEQTNGSMQPSRR